jgi:hypothetical protein
MPMPMLMPAPMLMLMLMLMQYCHKSDTKYHALIPLVQDETLVHILGFLRIQTHMHAGNHHETALSMQSLEHGMMKTAEPQEVHESKTGPSSHVVAL